MLRSPPMQQVTLLLLGEDVPAASMLLAESEGFHPAPLPVQEEWKELPDQRYRELYESAQRRLQKIAAYWPPAEIIPDEVRPQTTPEAVTQAQLEGLNEQLGTLWQALSLWEETYHRLLDQHRTLAQIQESLKIFAGLGIDLSLLQRPMQFLSLQVGIVAPAYLPSLAQALRLVGYFATSFHASREGEYVLLAGPAGTAEGLGELLRMADFRPLVIPAEFQDYPARIADRLAAQSAEIERKLEEHRESLHTLGCQHAQELAAVASRLEDAAPYAELAACLQGRGSLALLSGWTLKAALPALEETLRNRLGRPFVFNHRDPAPGEWQKVPSCLQHPRILQPFAGLVKLFGVPRYQEIDPTLIFTFAFLCLFGMMFGDVGHGASLMLLAWLLRARFPPAVPPLLGAAGTASMVFGFLYGSVFGHEQLISPLWVSPADDPLRILQAGIYTGIGFILVTSVMSVVNLLGEGHLREALWDRRGLAGILVYLGGIYAFSRWLATSEFGAREWVSLLGPLGLLLAYRGWMAEGSPAERLLVACIEGLDTAMGYLTNTLSFMRVAAFSLSHAALAVTVFTLADRYPAPGQWLLLVLGNALIVALEGGIVTIQVLRLSYYEGFSRFFRGDGHAFRPLRLRRRAGSVHVAETISGKG